MGSEAERDVAGFYAAFFGEGVRDALGVVQEAQYLCLFSHVGKVGGGEFGQCECRGRCCAVEEQLEGAVDARLIQVVKLSAKYEAACGCRVDDVPLVCGAGKWEGVPLHLAEQFVDQAHFPGTLCRLPVHEERIHFVEDEKRAGLEGFGKGRCDVLLAFSDVFVQEVGRALGKDVYAHLFGDVAHKSCFARSRRSAQAERESARAEGDHLLG